jgi:dTMP kinase
VAYQSGGRGLAAEDVVALSAFATEGVRPDLVVLLDLDPAVARARREERTGVPDKLEAEAGDFHARVRAAFLARARRDPERYLVLDAKQGPRVQNGAIQDRLDTLLPPSAAEAEAAARREAERAAAIAKEREFQAARAAAEAEARAAAEAEDRRRREEELAERQKAEQDRVRKAAEDRAARDAAEQEARDRAEAEEAERTETQKREAERREQQHRIQTQQDALRRREAVVTVRQAEARAKERARLAAAAAKTAQEQARRRTSLADDLMRLGHAEADEGAIDGPESEGGHP